MPYENQSTDVKIAYKTIYDIAFNHTSSSAETCEDFLFAWYNAHAWGGWAPHSISALDRENVRALLAVLTSISCGRMWYPPSDDMDRLAERKGRQRVARGDQTVKNG